MLLIEPTDLLPRWVQGYLAVPVILGATTAIGAFAWKGYKLAKFVETIYTCLMREFSPNGGDSLHDRIRRADARAEENNSNIALLKGHVADLTGQFSETMDDQSRRIDRLADELAELKSYANIRHKSEPVAHNRRHRG